MTQQFIALADRLIGANGQAATLYAKATDGTFDAEVGDKVAGGVKASEADFTTISASGSAFTIGSGSFTAQGFAAGQRVKLALGDGRLTNRGPFTVTGATASTLTVSGSLDALTNEDDFWLYATASAPAGQAAKVVSTDPGGVMNGSSAFPGVRLARENMLIQQHSAFLLSAKGLTAAPKPGDTLSLADGRSYTILDLSSVQPAGVPIVYLVLGKEE